MNERRRAAVDFALLEHNTAVLTWAATGPNEYHTGEEVKGPLNPVSEKDQLLLVDHLAHSAAMIEICAKHPLVPVDLDEEEAQSGQLLLPTAVPRGAH